MKREKMKDINEDIRMLDKALAAPDVTGGIKEYFAEKRATLEVQKKKLSDQVKSSSKKFEELGIKESQAAKQEAPKDIERSEEDAKAQRDGGIVQVGLARRGFPCIMCGDLLATGLAQCPSCGARTLKGIEARNAQVGGAVLSNKTGVIVMIIGAGITLGAVLIYFLL